MSDGDIYRFQILADQLFENLATADGLVRALQYFGNEHPSDLKGDPLVAIVCIAAVLRDLNDRSLDLAGALVDMKVRG